MKRILLSVLTACSLMTAHATLFQYSVNLDGPSEPTSSLGIGFGTVNYDDSAHSLQLQVSFSGLTNSGSGVTASHIHAATASPFTGNAGVATTSPTFAGFPSAVTSGTYSNTLDLTSATSWNNAFINPGGSGTPATAEAALATAMAAGEAYWNIHSQTFPSGEIRGFLVAVPEPSTLALAGMGVVAIAARVWGRKGRANKP